MVPAILVLADGSVFRGTSIGSNGSSTGEIVFNTAMTAYQEALTDPSYQEQLLMFTYPHIGNVGVNEEDFESAKITASGLIVRSLSPIASSFRAEKSLSAFLQENNTVAIAEIDTRQLTRILRNKGTQAGCIYAGDDAYSESAQAKALEQAKAYQAPNGQTLVEKVACKSNYAWQQGGWVLGQGFTQPESFDYHVVVYDFGVKRSVLRTLAGHGCKLTVVPPTTTAEEVLALKPDGVFLSNGPGDATGFTAPITAVKALVEADVPVFALCFGLQVLALAFGAKINKLAHGHYGANHPVQNVATRKVMITAQSHHYAIDAQSLGGSLELTHRSLFDGTVQGIQVKGKNAFGLQGYPELSSVPVDVAPLYSEFLAHMKAQRV